MRDNITYGMRNYEIMQSAMGIVIFELAIYSFIVGIHFQIELGIAFFLIIMLLIIFSKTFTFFIFLCFSMGSTFYVYHRLKEAQEPHMLYLFTAIAFIFIINIHTNAYYFYHEPEDEYYEEGL